MSMRVNSKCAHQVRPPLGTRSDHRVDPWRLIAGSVSRTDAAPTQKAHRPARYTGAGASGRHPRPRKGLRPPRHRSCHRQDDLFSCPGERTTGAYGCAVGTAGRGARHDRSPDSPAHSRDARDPRHRSTEATGQGAAGGVSRSVTRRCHRGRRPPSHRDAGDLRPARRAVRAGALVRVRELAEAEGGRRWRDDDEVARGRAEGRPRRGSVRCSRGGRKSSI